VPLDTQLMMLAAALLNTVMRIVTVFMTFGPLVSALVCALGACGVKIASYIIGRREARRSRVAEASRDDDHAGVTTIAIATRAI
jgi:hypothetical protein